MKKPERIDVRALIPELYQELLHLLQNLSLAEWDYPTSNSKWTVKDIAAHLIDTDLRRISFQRDKLNVSASAKQIKNNDQLVEYINHLNDSWIEVSKRLIKGVLIDLLNYVSIEIPKLFNSFDMEREATFGVIWAGEVKSKNWFDIAREYTEKWCHQQQIREAVGKPLLKDEKWIYPLLDTFVRGLPNIYQKIYPNKTESIIFIDIEDISQGKWILKKNTIWELFMGIAQDYSSKVIMNADTAWRLFSRNISIEEANKRIIIEGDQDLCQSVLKLTAFMK
jgi:hypothetical protein